MCMHRVEWEILLRHTFFTGDVGVVTWLVGLVGDEVLMPVGAGVVLLLTDAEGLLLSEEESLENEATKMHENVPKIIHVFKPLDSFWTYCGRKQQ